MEWLEPDGLGGFAMGTASGIRTRRYHALLLVATTPPTGRMVLVNGLDAWLETPAGNVALSSQLYHPGVMHPEGVHHLQKFERDPWPRWRFQVENGPAIDQELFVPHGSPAVVLSWRLLQPARQPVTLCVRPFLSGRDYHALQRENPAFNFEPKQTCHTVTWQPYPGVPGITSISNADYRHDPAWYRQFFYEDEQARGLDDREDLASPGVLRFDLAQQEALLLFTTAERAARLEGNLSSEEQILALRARERLRRQGFSNPLHRAADAYLVDRSVRAAHPSADGIAPETRGKTIVAGYPWFTDWGRDTFIALRGLCLSTGRLNDARDILLAWSETVSAGMLPNRFPDHGGEPEFNSVDASLWFVIAAHEYLQAAATAGMETVTADRDRLSRAILAIVQGYRQGTRFGIRMDDDHLLRAGQPGVQLTWMDAKVGDWVVTPRIGKPVEVQALWLNALQIAGQWDPASRALAHEGRRAFLERFWNEAAGCLYDVVDVDHQPGRVDAAFRPNQILAVGGLPFALLEGTQARRVVDAVEQRLWTPLGLRSLAPGESAYAPRYEGGVRERDGAYHQGTVWPWLMGPFVEAWLRVRGQSAAARRAAAQRFVQPLREHLRVAGLNHVSEVADADAPHLPRGCPFQAWSMGELLRMERLLGEGAVGARRNTKRPSATLRWAEAAPL